MLNDLTPKKNQVVFGDDSVVIQKYISGIKGGRTLDVAGMNEPSKKGYGNVIKAGAVVYQEKDTGKYKVCDLSGEGKTRSIDIAIAKFVGVLYRSIPVSNPAASIMTMGEVNEAAMPYPFGSEDIKEAFLKDCPHIVFIKDEEA